jgi:hypothetical protein
MVTVRQLREVLAEVDDDDAEVVIELPGAYRPVDGISVRSTREHGTQLVVRKDL